MRDWDDDRLLAALGQALKAREAVPSWFIETGKSAFAWHDIDAELAQLTYDSHQDQHAVAMLRSEDLKEGLTAFIEKRAPQWQGR